MSSRFPHGPPWAIRSGFAGLNSRTGLLRPVRPSGILSVTVVPTVSLRSVPAFLSGSAARMPRPSGHVRLNEKTSSLGRVTSKLGGIIYRVRVGARTMGLIQATPLEERRASLEGVL